VTAQIIAGFSPPAQASAPALNYISDRLYLIRKQTMGEKVKEKVANLFRAASNLFGGIGNSSEGWFARVLDRITGLGRRLGEFDYRDLGSWFRRSRQIQVQPLQEELPS
jgi:hypothetical protein